MRRLIFALIVALLPVTGNAQTLPLLHAVGNYFETPAGKAVYLAGIHTWDDMVDEANTGGISGAPTTAFPYADFLTWMNSEGANFIRLWNWEGNSYGTGWPAQMTVTPQPYVFNGTQFDLTQLNQPFFDRVLERVNDAAAAGIYVDVQLFPVITGNASDPNWTTNPFNSGMNVNGVSSSVSTIYAQTSGTVWNYQMTYLNKLLDTLQSATNVIYEVTNEQTDSTGDRAWQQAIVSAVHSYESGHGYVQHSVGITAPYPPMTSVADTNRWMYSSNADWMSPSGTDGSFNDNNIVLAPATKPSVLDTDHLGTEDWIWVWQSFMRGYNPLDMDDLEDTTPTIEAGSQNLNCCEPGNQYVRQNEGYSNTVAKMLPMEKMVPSSSIASTGYALADPADGYYTAFSVSGSSFTMDISGANGLSLNIQWMDLKNGTFQAAGTVFGGPSAQSFSPPTTDYAVLVLTPVTGPPPPPPPPPVQCQP